MTNNSKVYMGNFSPGHVQVYTIAYRLFTAPWNLKKNKVEVCTFRDIACRIHPHGPHAESQLPGGYCSAPIGVELVKCLP